MFLLTGFFRNSDAKKKLKKCADLMEKTKQFIKNINDFKPV